MWESNTEMVMFPLIGGVIALIAGFVRYLRLFKATSEEA
jgi:cobalamin synthase